METPKGARRNAPGTLLRPPAVVLFLGSVLRAGHDLEVRGTVTGFRSSFVIHVLAFKCSLAVLLDHEASGSISSDTLLDLLRTSLVGFVIFGILAT